jgi:di/tripeptidase
VKKPKKISACNRVTRKIRRTQHQNLEFGHTTGEIFKKPAKKKKLAFKGDEIPKTINFGGKLSFILSFYLSCLQCCYIYLHGSYLL